MLTANNNLDEYTPASILQLFQALADSARRDIKEHPNQVTVSGKIGKMEDTPYPTFYNVSLSDGGYGIRLDIPKRIIERVPPVEGDYVRATGIITARLDPGCRLEFRLAVSDIRLTYSPEEVERQRREQDSLNRIKEIAGPSRTFPNAEQVSITVVCGNTSEVLDDFVHNLGSKLSCNNVRTNMLSATAVSETITNTNADVIALIRGGGDAEQFAVFDDMRVVEAVAAQKAYVVLALGHTKNRSLADLVADHSTNVPADAGRNIREKWELIRAREIAENFALKAAGLNADLTRAQERLTQYEDDLRQARTTSATKAQEVAVVVEALRSARERTLTVAVGVGLAALALGFALARLV